MTGNLAIDLNTLLASCEFKRIHVPLQWLDTHHESRVRTLMSEEPGYSFAARELGSEQRMQRVRMPAVHLHRFENAVISTQSSSVFLSDRVLVERVVGVEPELCDFATGQILSHDTTSAQVGIRGAVIDVPRGIFLGGNGSFNYYHLLIEILPRLQHLLGDPLFANYPLLVDGSVAQIANYRQLIDTVSGGHPYLTLRSDRGYRIGSLAYVSAPNNVPFNLRPDVTAELGYTLTRPSTVAFLQERFKRLAAPAANLPKRVFFARRRGTRNYNQDEIEPLFAERGFISVYMEDLSIAEQVQLMGAAELVAGPPGSAWANLTFMRRGARALSWTPYCCANCACFANLAKAAGVDLRYMYYAVDDSSSRALHRDAYRLDPEAVRRALDQFMALADPDQELPDYDSALIREQTEHSVVQPAFRAGSTDM
jgi:hypothetical protein